MKYLPLYKKWMRAGKITGSGLCYALPNGHSVMKLIFDHPGYEGLWGYDGTHYMSWILNDTEYNEIAYRFTPLRQNMVLLLAAMNNEL